MRAMLLETHTSCPAEVVEWDKETRTITAQPVLQRKTKSGDLKTLPPIPRVPIMYPGGDEWEIFWPMAPGDEVLLLVSERSVDKWLKTGGIVDPEDPRIHDLSDAFCIPRTWNLSDVDPAEEGRLVIQKRDGSVRIELADDGTVTVTGTEVKLGDSSAVDSVALATIVDGLFNAFADTFNAHTHQDPLSGVTGIPNTPIVKPLQSTAASKVKAK